VGAKYLVSHVESWFSYPIAGETDFPCITDVRVGQGRSYVKVEGPLTYRKWIEGIRSGRSYVSNGYAHLMDFTVNNVSVGTENSEVHLASSGMVHASVRMAAMLAVHPNPSVAKHDPGQYGHTAYWRDDAPNPPYWDIERARSGESREVPVELVVNGKAVQRKLFVANGSIQNISFEVPITQSSWVAFRILPAAHTNPIFVVVNGKPIRTSAASAQWALDAVRQCWSQKRRQISSSELDSARGAYDHAEQVYKQLKEECEPVR